MAPKNSHAYKVLNRAVGKVLHHYVMISDGDRAENKFPEFVNPFGITQDLPK